MLIYKRPKMNDFRVSSSTTNWRIDRFTAMANLVYTISNHGVHYTKMGDRDMIYVYHAEKVRRKTRRTGKRQPHPTVEGKPYRAWASVVVRQSHWKVRIFAFPSSIVKSVQQGPRTFKLELK